MTFQKGFVEPILSGRKTATRRFWKRPLDNGGSIENFRWNNNKEGIFSKAKFASPVKLLEEKGYINQEEWEQKIKKRLKG